jgi:hypothetical protein
MQKNGSDCIFSSFNTRDMHSLLHPRKNQLKNRMKSFGHPQPPRKNSPWRTYYFLHLERRMRSSKCVTSGTQRPEWSITNQVYIHAAAAGEIFSKSGVAKQDASWQRVSAQSACVRRGAISLFVSAWNVLLLITLSRTHTQWLASEGRPRGVRRERERGEPPTNPYVPARTENTPIVIVLNRARCIWKLVAATGAQWFENPSTSNVISVAHKRSVRGFQQSAQRRSRGGKGWLGERLWQWEVYWRFVLLRREHFH